MSVRTELAVTKMHGAHNTFVVIDERPPAIADYAALAVQLCDPDGELGGADGVLVIRDAPEAYARMRVFNADGSEAEMCGNGIRCVAKYLADRGSPASFALATLAGPIGVEVLARDPFEARVDMGTVTFPSGAIAERVAIGDADVRFYAVDVGNPHAVTFVSDPDAVDLEALGVAFNRHPRFHAGTNLHLVCVDGPSAITVRHYERGVGLTAACGTGAVASAAVAIVARGVASPVDVRVPGGMLGVAWQPNGRASLTGPARTVFERTIEA